MILTAIGSFVVRVSGIISFMLITPYLFAGLGERVFGIYQFTQRLSAFGGVSNLGATSFLKIRLSELAREVDQKSKREAVAECIGQWVAMTPILIVWLWATQSFISHRAALSLAEQFAVFSLLLLTPVSQIFSIGQVAMFAAGLGYRGTFVFALLGLLTAASAAAMAQLKLGLPGVALAMWLGATATATYTTLLARGHLEWFGASWPGWARFRAGFGQSGGAALASLAYLGLQQLEALVFGFALGPSALGHMVLTCAGVQLLEMTVRSFIGSTGFTLAPAVMAGDRERLGRLRREVQLSITLFFALGSAPIVVLSPWVLKAWVPGAAFLGHGVIAAVLLTAYFRVLAQFDGVLLDQARSFHKKTLLLIPIVIAPAAAVALVAAQRAPPAWYFILPIAVGIYALTLGNELRRLLGVQATGIALFLPVVACSASALGMTLTSGAHGLWGAIVSSMALFLLTLAGCVASREYRDIIARIVGRILILVADVGRRRA